VIGSAFRRFLENLNDIDLAFAKTRSAVSMVSTNRVRFSRSDPRCDPENDLHTCAEPFGFLDSGFVHAHDFVVDPKRGM